MSYHLLWVWPLGQPIAAAPVEIAATALLLEKDFTDELPIAVRAHNTQPRNLPISIQDKAHLEVLVYFKKGRVELASPVAGVNVSVGKGFAVNLGTDQEPLMAVPIIV